MARALCIKCGGIMAAKLVQAGEDYHVNCAPDEPIKFGTAKKPADPLAEELKRDLTEVVRWIEGNTERSQQVALGPSELGYECDRRIAFGVAGAPKVNLWTDPWPAIVGSAIHNWLERGFDRYQGATGTSRWVTELAVQPDDVVRGHLDLYDNKLPGIIDWKSKGPSKMKEWVQGGPPLSNLMQVNLYGYAAKRMGLRVEKVALIGVPRSGWLRDFEPYVFPYDESIALEALDRMYRIAGRVMELECDKHPDNFDLIEAKPNRGDCQWCPWFRVRGDGPGCSGVIS